MQIRFLGTAAAEGYPGLFCDCDNCHAARLAGGKSLRLRASAIINDDLALDFGPDLLANVHRFGLNLAALRSVLITHYHEDHWLLDNLLYHHKWFLPKAVPTLHLYGGPLITTEIEKLLARHKIEIDDLGAQPHVVEAFQTFSVVPDYEVKAFPAIHSPETQPFFYSITQAGRRLLYITDTGPLPEETLQSLAGLQAHMLVLELGLGEESNYEFHLNINDFQHTIASMRKDGALTPNAPVVAFHFSHHYFPTHEQLEKQLVPLGIIPAYDGLVLEV